VYLASDLTAPLDAAIVQEAVTDRPIGADWCPNLEMKAFRVGPGSASPRPTRQDIRSRHGEYALP